MNTNQVFTNALKPHQLDRYSYDKISDQALKNQIIYDNSPSGYQQLGNLLVSEDDIISNKTIIDSIQRVGVVLFNRY